ncbi:MAG: hypothetical protein FWE17_00725 [Alphaproteobacteria bacterium]|nr:hypothetical protein [Alphaproteobacteria bacterium]MCL2758217.1 hypothetical protein [Alphaproteobacteria bacterium]
MTKFDAERRLAALLLEDMPVMEFVVRPVAVAPDWFATFRKLRREFMESLDDSIQELSFLDLSQNDFMDLLRGMRLPENLSVRWRVPLEYGGKLSKDNMFMCPTFFAGQNMDRFILEQSGRPSIWLPNPVKKIYVPTNLITGGPGGNAASDRMTNAFVPPSMGRE